MQKGARRPAVEIVESDDVGLSAVRPGSTLPKGEIGQIFSCDSGSPWLPGVSVQTVTVVRLDATATMTAAFVALRLRLIAAARLSAEVVAFAVLPRRTPGSLVL